MGLFDYVHVHDARFVCSEGHDLRGEEFQTKDLGCTMGDSAIGADGVLDFRDGGYGDPPKMPLNETIATYCTCRKCPAFVQDGTSNLIAMGVDFEVKFEGGRAVSVTRVGATTAEWLAKTPGETWMVGCLGPMTYEEARKIHVDGIGRWTRAKWGKS
jgi:hypothetical protein